RQSFVELSYGFSVLGNRFRGILCCQRCASGLERCIPSGERTHNGSVGFGDLLVLFLYLLVLFYSFLTLSLCFGTLVSASRRVTPTGPCGGSTSGVRVFD